jgi:hypothetical protein
MRFIGDDLMTIRTEQLRSTALASATYDDENATLSITFVNGSTYDYHDVPQEIFDGLVDASSPGQYWHSSIKDVYR